ncbi:Autoimmune regulator [Trema orientale]|uniref:Autoimmune regulator n=1 Tax=Trema orientale TaxID=63057 RepID=A0A2P5F8P8_TREOI|nr:Autoimmune regulator [Trema orientale]
MVNSEGGEQFEDASVAMVGEKRPAENGGDSELAEDHHRLNKRPRNGVGDAGGLKRVAEIVLVLSTMAKIRGGKKPTEVEIGLMAEARTKLVELCEGLAPKDIVAGDAIGAVIEDLGLNDKVKDQKLGFRGPRLTIAERFSQTKRKMEESRKYAGQSSPYASHPLQTNFNPAAESRASPHTLRMIPSDKQSHQPMSSVGAPTSFPLGHVSTEPPASVQYQLPTNDVRASTVSSGFTSNNLGRDSPSSALPRIERAQYGGPNGSALASQGQVNASTNNHLVNAPTRLVQTQAAKTGPEQNKPPNHTPAKVDGTAQMNVPRVTPQAPRDQSFRPFITQPAPANLPTVHQPLQATNYTQAASLSNSHNEIAKTVQKLLQPKLPDHPTWIPPSRDYMTKALLCQICLITIHEVDSVLICDACEKGYHTKCAQQFNLRVIPIPRGEWHCSRCLTLSNGKPLPPKYGRVMRSNTQAKIPSSTSGVQSSSEKKVENVDPKVSQQKITANGSTDLQTPTHTDIMALQNTDVDTSADSKSPNSIETQKNNFSSSISKHTEEKPVLGSGANISMKSTEAVSGSSAIASSENSSQIVKYSEPSTRQEESVEVKSLPLNHSSETVDNEADPSRLSVDSCVVDRADLSNSAEVALKKSQENNAMVKDPDKSHLNESSDCTMRYDTKRDEQDGAREDTVGSSATSSGVVDHSAHSLDGLHSVEWIGNVIHVVDEKIFYRTCSVGGSMWEDSKTGSKWVIVNRCYFPADLPGNVGRPCTTDGNEVYDSNHDSTVMAGLIQGPCEVLPPAKFKEENERRSQLDADRNSGLHPVFICKWLYDEFKGSFQPVSG